MKDNRPVNLNITTIKFPLAAIASITHRISGIALFVGTAILLYLLQLSLESQTSFDLAVEILSSPVAKLIIWLLLSALLYHLIAGAKHLLLDLGIGESKAGAKTGAMLTVVLAAIAIVLGGLWVW
ncbi:MAG: succinate dehydrogenase, cytochrome b556 subunit [Pseudomonadales bacterium]|nr:succinate dehydrogenase, cytochrome b556 subunit [Pseudomonadales bacterium]